jgi:aryl-alcohol dehydrogenase-like predicted oxidoreductase
MITGAATPEGTEAFGQKHANTAFRRLGKTDLTVSQAGFGCYRVAAGERVHERALLRAFAKGINLVDTSTNYADGESEKLVGGVLESGVTEGVLQRENVVVVSKVGYLQGANYQLSQERKRRGEPFPELVEYAQGLEHCIHPTFLEDQLTRSLQRLGLETVDVYLLHNPEYYLGRAKKDGMAAQEARREYHRRIRDAFAHLETEADRGRIRWYGVSSNTFVEGPDHAEFTSLDALVHLAEDLRKDHRFGVIQLPMNLMEPGAVLEANQPGDRNVLQRAADSGLGVLVNRPLNAIRGKGLFRLAEVEASEAGEPEDVVQAIQALAKSESALSHRILPELTVPSGLQLRIKNQLSVGEYLKHYWRGLETYERFRQLRDGVMMPRVQGVMDFLEGYRAESPALAAWMEKHPHRLDAALSGVGAMYAADAARDIRFVRHAVSEADADWAAADNLSQRALRAVRSTAGVTSVLVGMRREVYVDDVAAELARPISAGDRVNAWRRLSEAVNRG